jgi:hypothetical protein
LRRYLVQLDQVGVVAVEVLDGEEAVLARREDRLLFRLVGSADRENRALGRPLVAEPLEVGLAVRALPGEALARDLPFAPAAVPFLALGHLGQRRREPGHVVEGLHEFTVLSGPRPVHDWSWPKSGSWR